MKTIVNCISLAIAMLVTCSAADAQLNGRIGQNVFGQTANGAAFGQGVTPTTADITNVLPGRMWVGINLADRGLGYSGAYGTIGYKNLLFEDVLDGRWHGEIRSHIGAESGDPFVNIGIMRTMSLDSAEADVTTGLWFDWDGDKQGAFAHNFQQVSGNLSIKTRRSIFVINSYHTVGETDYTIGGNFNNPDGAFIGHRIVLQSGIDSALGGYEVNYQIAPERLGFINGTLEIGGYRYESDQIPSFLGVHFGVGMQPLRGAIVNFELNHDDRFSTTAAIQMTYLFGVNARGTEFSYLGQDLDPTLRNDHVLRFQRDLEFVIDPDTGVAYNVLHVSNDSAAGGSGTFEAPFDTLADAEAVSATDDIIFVWEGDGTSTGYQTGIVLKDRQLLLGDGVEHLVPTPGGTLFRLPNNLDNVLPTISGMPTAVTLANDNTVRGFNIDNSSGALVNGILHAGGSTITNGTFEDINISGGTGSGISVDDIAGNWTFRRVNSSSTGQDGIFIANACDPTSIFIFDATITSNNARDGIHMEDYDGLSFTFTDIIASNNGRDGVRLERFKDGSALASTLLFDTPTVSANGGFGIFVDDFEGNASFLDSQVTGNLAGGLHLENVTNNQAGTSTFVGTNAPGGTSNFLLNGLAGGAGIDIVLDEVGSTQNLLITDSTIGGITDNATFVLTGGRGIRAVSSGNGTTLNLNIIDNIAIANNISDNIQLISTAGATQNTVVRNNLAALNMDQAGGDIFNLIVGSANGGTEATLNLTVDNVSVNPAIAGVTSGAGSNVFQAQSQNDGVLNLNVTNLNADTITGSAVNLTFDNDGAGGINNVFFNNVNFTEVSGNGIVASTGTDTNTNLSFLNMNIQPIVAGSTNFNSGVAITTTGAAGGGVDNRTRVNLRNLTLGSAASPFDGNGISITANEDAELLANIENNTIINAGFGGGSNVLLPFLDGVTITANDAARIDARVTNNIIQGSGDIGLVVTNNSTNDVNLLLSNNTITGNDIGEDPANDPIIDSNFAEILFVNNGAGGNVCLAMTNNFFSAIGTEIFNFGAVGEFTLELDGFTNSPFITVNAPPGNAVTGAGFGTTCEPAIAAQETAFQVLGFPTN